MKCKFKSFWKEPTEKAVIDAIIRELLVLSLPGVLEEAIKIYQEESQKDTFNLLIKVSSEIEVKTTHINLLRDNTQLMASPDIAKHIEDLEAEISLMKARKAQLEANIKYDPLEQNTLDLIRMNLKQHAEQLTWEMLEIKGQILKGYIERIDAVNQNTGLAISFRLINPTQQDAVLLNKTLLVEIKTAE